MTLKFSNVPIFGDSTGFYIACIAVFLLTQHAISPSAAKTNKRWC
jgi:hypothetical protein